MNFGEPIILLTAVHFHFSGFAAALLAGQVTRRLPATSWAARLAALGSLLGPALVAAGFMLSETLKMGAVLFYSATLAALAFGQWRVSAALPPLSRMLLRLSSLCVLLGMGLVIVYETGLWLGSSYLSIPQMARWHGPLQAFGFVWCGLIGWAHEAGRQDPH